MQLKHWKIPYHNISNALKYADGIGIISFLFEADDDSNHFEPFEVIILFISILDPKILQICVSKFICVHKSFRHKLTYFIHTIWGSNKGLTSYFHIFLHLTQEGATLN